MVKCSVERRRRGATAQSLLLLFLAPSILALAPAPKSRGASMILPPQLRTAGRPLPPTGSLRRRPEAARPPPHSARSAAAALPALPFSAFSAPPPPATPTLAASVVGWTALSLALYCLRRGVLHGIGAAEVARRHLSFDPRWPRSWRGRVGFSAALLSWAGLFGPIYPLLEAALRPFGLAAFWYYYPKANGAGLLVEELPLREEDGDGGGDGRRRAAGDAASEIRGGGNGDALRGGRQVFRLDWHRFRVNVGPPGRLFPRGGVSRHPPAVELNRPHVDLPHLGVRHWPWKQHSALMGLVERDDR